MNKIKSHSIGKLTTILLVVVLLMPVYVKFAHIFDNHTHDVCQSKDAKHFHNIDHDCEFHKFKIINPLSLTTQDYSLHKLPEQKSDISFYYEFLSDYQSLHFNLRGPPHLI